MSPRHFVGGTYGPAVTPSDRPADGPPAVPAERRELATRYVLAQLDIARTALTNAQAAVDDNHAAHELARLRKELTPIVGRVRKLRAKPTIPELPL